MAVDDFGAFVEYMKGQEGLVHVSQIADHRVEKVEDYLQEGQAVRKLIMDRQGRVRLSIKQADPAEETASEEAASE